MSSTVAAASFDASASNAAPGGSIARTAAARRSADEVDSDTSTALSTQLCLTARCSVAASGPSTVQFANCEMPSTYWRVGSTRPNTLDPLTERGSIPCEKNAGSRGSVVENVAPTGTAGIEQSPIYRGSAGRLGHKVEVFVVDSEVATHALDVPAREGFDLVLDRPVGAGQIPGVACAAVSLFDE